MQQQQMASVVYMGGQATVASPPAYVIGQPAGVPSQPTYMVAVQPSVISTYNRKQSMGIGITLIVSAVLSFAFNSAELGVAVDQYYYYGFVWGLVCHGYWTGVPSVIAGSIAIAASRSATRSKIVALKVLCIISASLTCGQFIVGIIGAATTNSCSYYYSYYSCVYVRNVIIAMESLLAIMAVVEAVAAIWGAAICCKAYCPCGTTPEYQYRMPTVVQSGMPTMIVLNPATTVTGTTIGAQPVYFVRPTQVTTNSPNYGVCNNQGYSCSNPSAPEQCPTAGQGKTADENPPAYISNPTLS